MGDSDKRSYEALSALMDNASTEMETRRILRDLEHDGELRESWHRYHLASAALRRELPPRLVDLSSRISAAIADEKAPPLPSRYLQPLSKVAVAATVAFVAVLGVRQLQPGPEPAPMLAAAPEAVAPESIGTTGPQFQLPAGFDFPPVSGRMASSGESPATEPRPVTIMQQVQPDLDVQREIHLYLNTMMNRHTENASSSANQGVWPHVRFPQGDQE